MEPPRDENNQIHTEFARRIGEIVRQYKKLDISKDETFDTTLNLIALQSLLTILDEKDNTVGDGENILSKPVETPPGLGGIHTKLIKENTFEEGPITYKQLLTHMRHALSHPTDQLKSSSTGYTTTGSDPSKKIKEIRFVRAPSEGHNRGKVFCIEVPVKTIQELVIHLSDFLATANTK